MDEKKFDIKDFKKKHRFDKRELILDMPAVGLEPTYYWLTDYLQNTQGYNKRAKKNDEAIAATVASSFFSDLGAKRTRMEQRAKEIMVDINAVVKSILNLIYDLKEFDRRLEIFEDIHSLNKEKKEAGEMAIKSVWMDEVDVKRGVGSLNQLSSGGKLEFVTLRDAFMQAKSVKDVSGMDLNDRVKRIVKARIEEYEKWRKRYEDDLCKRRKIELLYLKAQVRTLKEYTTWAKPYLIAAQKLRMNQDLAKESTIDLVEFFDSTAITVSMRGCKQIEASSLFKELQIGRSVRGSSGRIREPADPVYAAIELNFVFGSKPILVSREGGPSYRHIGTIIVKFGAYVYTKSELEKLELAEQEEGLEMVKALDEMTEGSLDAIADDLDNYLKEKGDKKKNFEFKPLGNILEPFGDILKGFNELFGPLFSFMPKKDEKTVKLSRQDKWTIQLLKEEAKKKVKKDVYSLFKIYRKAHGLVTFRG